MPTPFQEPTRGSKERQLSTTWLPPLNQEIIFPANPTAHREIPNLQSITREGAREVPCWRMIQTRNWISFQNRFLNSRFRGGLGNCTLREWFLNSLLWHGARIFFQTRFIFLRSDREFS